MHIIERYSAIWISIMFNSTIFLFDHIRFGNEPYNRNFHCQYQKRMRKIFISNIESMLNFFTNLMFDLLHHCIWFLIGNHGMYSFCFNKWYYLCIIFWSTIKYSFGNWSDVNSRTNIKKYVQVCWWIRCFPFSNKNLFFSEIATSIFLNSVYGLASGFFYY